MIHESVIGGSPALCMHLVASSSCARFAALVASVTLAASTAQAWLFTSEPGSLATAALDKLPAAAEHQGELWHLNASPFDCTGCSTVYASTNGTRTVNAYVTWGVPHLQHFVPHPGGWEFRHVVGSCLSSRLEARRIEGQQVEASALLQKGRLQSFASRRLGCIGGSSTVYYSLVANSRYLAFKTAEPGFVFFDLKEGRFVPWALTTERAAGGMNLYADQSGALYVDDGFVPSAGRTLHKVVLGEQDLAAPLSKGAICHARAIAKRIDPGSGARPALGFDCNGKAPPELGQERR